MSVALPFDPNAPMHDPLLGTVIADRYRVLRLLGTGGMGQVYEAEQVALRRSVAIKCLHATIARQPEVIARFQQEALAATSVRNPHVVEIFDLGRLPDGTLFIAMELLQGCELSAVIARGPMAVGRIVRIALQLCDALIDVHARNIVHRDLKPDNVFLARHGGTEDFVKVLDFGISKIRDPAGAGASALTSTDSTLGTPLYMSPEQFGRARHVDHRADLYAVGGILYHGLAGRTPFVAPNLALLAIDVLNHPPPDLRGLRPGLPTGLAEAVHACLAKDPTARPADARALRALLAPYAALDDVPPEPASLLASRGGAAPARPMVTPLTPTPGAMAPPVTLAPPVSLPGHAAIADPSRPPVAATPTPVIVQSSTGAVMVLVSVLATLVVVGGLAIAGWVTVNRQSRAPEPTAVREAGVSGAGAQVRAAPPDAAPPVQRPEPAQAPQLRASPDPVPVPRERVRARENRRPHEPPPPVLNLPHQPVQQAEAPRRAPQPATGVLVHSAPGDPF